MQNRMKDEEETDLLFDEYDSTMHEDVQRSCLASAKLRKIKISVTVTVLTISNVIMFTASVFFIWFGMSQDHNCRRIGDQYSSSAASSYSPILNRFDIPKVVKTINASLYETSTTSIFRNTGDVGNHEWFRIGTGVLPIVVSSSDIIALGKNPSLTVNVPEQYGYGSDAYLAHADVFHHLHCVDYLRHEVYSPWRLRLSDNKPTSDEQHWAHIGHCIDILAQVLQCGGSVDMITFNWVEGWDQPFPDFATQKVCRDFDALLKWVEKHEVSEEAFRKLKVPEGYIRLPEPGTL